MARIYLKTLYYKLSFTQIITQQIIKVYIEIYSRNILQIIVKLAFYETGNIIDRTY